MPDGSFTVTPELYIDAEGNEVVSYEDAHISNTDSRARALEQFHAEQEDYLYFDERTGITHHMFADESVADLDPDPWEEEPDYDTDLFRCHRRRPRASYTEAEKTSST